MDNTKVINVLSFCTGYGGIELGLSQVFDDPIRCVAVEIEAFAAANLVAKAEQGKLGIEAVYSDLKKFPAKKFRGCFDIITAGYPCQPFSHAGKRAGKADPRHLWPFIRDHIQQIKPILVICENVAGHLSLGFDRVVSDLDDLGYTTSPGIFAAEEVGAPHRRERLFFVAYDMRCTEPQFTRRDSLRGQTSCGQTRNSVRPGAGHRNERGDTAERTEKRQRDPRQLQENDELEVADPANGTAGSGSIMDNPECAEPGSGEQGIEKEQGSRQELATAECGGDQLWARLASKQRKLQKATRWPARPGQPQYEWEQPRVILSAADYKILKGYVEKYQTRLTEGQDQAMAHAEALYAPEPEVGGVPYGFTSRVDELRLLGNGVLPEQLAMAITELIEMMERDECIK